MAREAEVLTSKVRQDGKGEDPVIQALVSDEYATMPDAEVVEINLALQQLLRGQASLLDNAERNAEEIAKLKQRFEEYDRAAERWETDRARFMEEINQRAEKLRVVGPEKDRMEANNAQMVQNAMRIAAAERTRRRQELDHLIETQPKVTITDPGLPIMVREGQAHKMRVENEVVQLGHRRFIFPAGKPIEVPLVVADAYYEKKKRREEADDRKNATALNPDGTMGPQHEQNSLAKAFKKIDQKYGVVTQEFPLR